MDDYTEQRIVQSRGPAIEFAGRLIASDEFEVKRDNSRMRLEIWESRAGALIAVTRGETWQGGDVREIVDARVVEPDVDGLSETAMCFNVMAHFDWSDRARSMVRKQLKWKLVWRIA